MTMEAKNKGKLLCDQEVIEHSISITMIKGRFSKI